MDKQQFVLDYARKQGLINPTIIHSELYGYELRGEGRCGKWPLVWQIAEKLGISWGCGGSNYHQIRIENLVLPEDS